MRVNPDVIYYTRDGQATVPLGIRVGAHDKAQRE